MEPEQRRIEDAKGPLVLIWQPDGSLALGADPLRVPHKERPSAQQASSTAVRQLTPEESAALEERRARAVRYQQTTLWKRKGIFIALTGCDLLFFCGALIYQASIRQQLRNDFWTAPEAEQPGLSTDLPVAEFYSRSEYTIEASNSSTDWSTVPGSRSQIMLSLAWWVDPRSLRLEHVILNIAIDLIAIAGAMQLRTAVLFLYCVLQLLSTTAITTTAGVNLSLFTLWRLAALLLALYLRSAILTYTALLEAADLPFTPGAAARLQRVLSHTAVSQFLNMLSTPGRSRRQGSIQPSDTSDATPIMAQQSNAAGEAVSAVGEDRAPIAVDRLTPVAAEPLLRRSTDSAQFELAVLESRRLSSTPGSIDARQQ